MNIESLLPVFILLAVFLFAFAIEGVVMTFCKLKPFWPALGTSILLNLASLFLIYFLARPFLSVLGYDLGKFNGINLHLQVAAFLWWFCSVAEGCLLLLFLRRKAQPSVLLVALAMNLASFVFLYLFDLVSH